METPRASAVLHDSPRTLTLNIQSAKRHTNVTKLVSIYFPRIAHDSILTLSENCTCGISTGFRSSARQPTLTLNIQSAKRHANVTQLVSIFSPRITHDPLPTLSENCNCGTSTVFCTVKPKHLSLYNNGCNQSKNCTWRNSGLCTVCTVPPGLSESN